ncbi:MAG: DUF4347 domain-containing protein [Oceanospirillaceae bacterium]|nr:DUF4347 domain-containing protein [Oceanospirillaceae bacterium]
MMFDGAVAATTAETLGDTQNATAPDDTSTPDADATPATATATTDNRQEVIFVDSQVRDYQQLLVGLPADTEIVVLESTRNGLEQMAEYLQGRENIDAIHLLSHGESGAFKAGNIWLDADNLTTQNVSLEGIGKALTAEGDILLYGCKTSEGDAGNALITEMARLTQADVAASTNNTGAQQLGGDWSLEAHVGTIEAASVGSVGMVEFVSLLAAPTSENFDSVSLTGGYNLGTSGQARILNGWTFEVLGANGLIDSQGFIDYTNQTTESNMADGSGDVVARLQGSYLVGTSGTQAAAVLKATDGSEFSLSSIRVEHGFSDGRDYRLVGYLNGSAVAGATQDFNASAFDLNAQVNTGGTVVSVSGGAWQFIDEVRIVRPNGALDISVYIDDITVTTAVPANEPPIISNLNGDSVNYLEGSSAVLLDSGSDATLSDPDDNFNGGSVTVAITGNRVISEDQLAIANSGLISTSGSNVIYNAAVIGTFTGGSGINDLVVTLNANANATSVQALLRNLSYVNSNSGDPSTLARTVAISVADGDGGISNTANVSVAIDGVNDAPTLTATGTDPTFTEGGSAADLFSGVSVSTVEAGQTLAGLTLTVSNIANGSDEILNIDGTAIVLTHGTSGTTTTNSLNYSVSVTGTTATVSLSGGNLSAAAAQTLVDSLSYQNNSQDPGTGNRVVTLTSIQDSGGTANGGSDTASLAVASTVTLVSVNDEPTLTATASNPTFTEGGSAASLFSGTSIDTVEAGQNITGLSFTVTNVINGSNERINVDGTTIVLTHGTNGITATNSLNYSVSVVGSTATVSLTGGVLSTAAAETLVDNMSYQNNSNAPSTSNRVVTLTSIQDGGGTANGGDNTGSLAVASTVTVVQNNDAPTLTATGTDPTFIEGFAAVDLFSGVSISTVEAGQTLAGLTLTVSNLANGSDEILNIDGTAIGLTDGTNGVTATNSLSYSVAISGTTATVSLSGGTLSTAAAQTLVDGMSYQNNSDDPGTSNRVVTLTSLQDSGGTANGGIDTASLAVASTVTVISVNDAPTLTATGSNPTFTEGAAAADLFSGVSMSTIEAGQTLTDLTLTVSNVANGSDEILNIDGTAIVLTNASLGTTATHSLNYSVSVSGTTATVSLGGGTLSAAAAQTLVDNLSYQNNSQDPGTGNRVVTLTSLQDSGGTANGGIDTASLAVASTVTVISVNDAPTLTATGTDPDYIENSGAVDLFSGVAVDSIESGQNIFEISLTVTNLADGGDEILRADGTDILLVDGSTGSTAGNSIFYFVGVTGTTATVELRKLGGFDSATAETLIDGLGYRNDSDSPSTTSRVVTLTGITDVGGTANGGSDSTALAIASTVSLTSVNDSPTLTATGTDPSFTEGGATVDLFSSVSISTVEAGQTLTGLTLTVAGVADGSAELLDADGTAIALTHGNGGTTATNALAYSVSVSGNTATVTLSGGTLSTAAAQTLVDGLGYRNTSEVPTTTDRIVTLTSLQDSGGTANGGDDTASLAIASTVSIAAINNAPTLTATGTNPGYIEGAAAVDLFNGVIIDTIEPGQTITALELTLSNVFDGSDEVLNFNGAEVNLAGVTSGTTITFVYDFIPLGGISVAQAQSLLDNISYRNTSEDPTAGDRVMTITLITDNGGTDNGGNDTANPAITSTVTVTAVNDAPVNNVPAAQSTDQNQDLVFSGANGNAITISDPDAGGGTVRVTLTADNGLLKLSGTAGLSFISGTGSNDATLTIEGTLADINTALNGLAFTPTPGYNGAASLQIDSDDLGLSGSGGAQTDSDSIAITVNGTNPEVAAVQTSTPDGSYKVGDNITLSVTFDQAVTVDTTGGAPTLLLETGAVDRQATYLSGSGTDTLIFSYTVQAGDLSADLDYQSSAALSLNGATIRNTGGDDAILTLPATGSADSLAGQHALVIDGIAPTVTSVGVPADGTYVAGQTLDFTVNFNEAVIVTTASGTPRLAIDLDTGGTVYADYLSGTGTSALLFRYSVQNGQQDSTGIAIGASLEPNGGTLRDAVGNDAATTLIGTGNTSGVLIDAVPPTVDSVTVPADGAYRAGDVLSFTLNASETVLVDTAGGSPRLTLDIGGVTRYANYVSGSGSDTLLFQYRVVPGDTDSDGIAVGASLDANGGSLRDAAGNILKPALNGLGNTDGVILDTTAPVADSLVRAEASPTAGGNLRFDLTFSEVVSGVDAGDFSLVTTGNAVGTLDSITTADNRSYQVLVSGVTGNGTLGLSLNAAASGIQDAAGNGLAAGLTAEPYAIVGDNGDPEFRVETFSTAPAVPTPLPVPAPPPQPPSDLDSPLLPPPLFDKPTLGSGVPTLGALFDAGGIPAPSVIAQVFAGYHSGFGDGSGRGFLGFGGGDAGVFGVSALSDVFQQEDEPEYRPLDAFGNAGGDQSPPILGISGAPTLDQQLSEMRTSEERMIGQLAQALEQFRPGDPKS